MDKSSSPSPPSPLNPDLARLQTEILVGLLTPPVLLGLLVARTLSEGLTQAGLISEQLLQGQRLPNLNIHSTPTT